MSIGGCGRLTILKIVVERNRLRRVQIPPKALPRNGLAFNFRMKKEIRIVIIMHFGYWNRAI